MRIRLYVIGRALLALVLIWIAVVALVDMATSQNPFSSPRLCEVANAC